MFGHSSDEANSLHAGQADPDLVLDQLADRAQATVAEVVDVVDAVVGLAGVETHDVLDGGDDVVLGQRGRALRHNDAELLVDLVPADIREFVALGVDEQVLQQRLRGLTRRRLARPQLFPTPVSLVMTSTPFLSSALGTKRTAPD